MKSYADGEMRCLLTQQRSFAMYNWNNWKQILIFDYYFLLCTYDWGINYDFWTPNSTLYRWQKTTTFTFNSNSPVFSISILFSFSIQITNIHLLRVFLALVLNNLSQNLPWIMPSAQQSLFVGFEDETEVMVVGFEYLNMQIEKNLHRLDDWLG